MEAAKVESFKGTNFVGDLCLGQKLTLLGYHRVQERVPLPGRDYNPNNGEGV